MSKKSKAKESAPAAYGPAASPLFKKELGLETFRSFTVTDAAGETHLCLLSPDPAGAVSVPAWTFSLLPPGPATVRWTDLDTGQTGSLDLDLGPGERVTAYMTQ